MNTFFLWNYGSTIIIITKSFKVHDLKKIIKYDIITLQEDSLLKHFDIRKSSFSVSIKYSMIIFNNLLTYSLKNYESTTRYILINYCICTVRSESKELKKGVD